MYFIPRNNKVYHYIAHMNKKNRYMYAGFFVVCTFFLISYFLQRLINVYHDLYAQELISLRKQYKDNTRIADKNKQLMNEIQKVKTEIQHHMIVDGSLYIKQQLLFVLEAIKKISLQLNAYGIQKEKNGEWYIKERAHFDVTGSFTQLMAFFELLKKSERMIVVSQWSLAKVNENVFHMQCDIEFIVIKSLQL